jgi:adenosylmethionine-8-amino-7-oxononanoate aminotransferase
LSDLAERPGVRAVRVLGAICAIDLEPSLNVAAIAQRIVERGVWLRPLRATLYATPAFTIAPDELTTIIAALRTEICTATSG